MLYLMGDEKYYIKSFHFPFFINEKCQETSHYKTELFFQKTLFHTYRKSFISSSLKYIYSPTVI